jgi:hypothetical protein
LISSSLFAQNKSIPHLQKKGNTAQLDYFLK